MQKQSPFPRLWELGEMVDDGRIVQQGRHEDLIGQKDVCAEFFSGRKEAGGWKLNAQIFKIMLSRKGQMGQTGQTARSSSVTMQ